MAKDREIQAARALGSLIVHYTLNLQICVSLMSSHAAGLELLNHGTQLAQTDVVEAALAALGLAIRAIEHGPTRLHQTAYETAIMAVNVAMHAMHGNREFSIPGPLSPSTPPPGE